MNYIEREIYDRYAYDKKLMYVWRVYEEFERRVNSTKEEYEGLKTGECRFDYHSWGIRLDLSNWQMNNAIKKLMLNGYIEQIEKGKKGTQSKYYLTRFKDENDQQKNQQNDQQKKTSDTNGLKGVNQQNDQQKNLHSSIYNNLNIKSNINNINSSDNEKYFEEVNKKLEEELKVKIKNTYPRELISKEFNKLKDLGFTGLDLLLELDKNLKAIGKLKEQSKEDDKIINLPKAEIKEIFDCWNNANIIKHKELTKDITITIQKALKSLSVEEIEEGIKNYSLILKSDYFFNYKWTLKEFLTRKRGISSFLNNGINKINYDQWKNSIKNIPSKSKDKTINFTQREYNFKELESNLVITENESVPSINDTLKALSKFKVQA